MTPTLDTIATSATTGTDLRETIDIAPRRLAHHRGVLTTDIAGKMVEGTPSVAPPLKTTADPRQINSPFVHPALASRPPIAMPHLRRWHHEDRNSLVGATVREEAIRDVADMECREVADSVRLHRRAKFSTKLGGQAHPNSSKA